MPGPHVSNYFRQHHIMDNPKHTDKGTFLSFLPVPCLHESSSALLAGILDLFKVALCRYAKQSALAISGIREILRTHERPPF